MVFVPQSPECLILVLHKKGVQFQIAEPDFLYFYIIIIFYKHRKTRKSLARVSNTKATQTDLLTLTKSNLPRFKQA